MPIAMLQSASWPVSGKRTNVTAYMAAESWISNRPQTTARED